MQLERTGKIEKSNGGFKPRLNNAVNTILYYGVRGHYGGTYAHWRVAVRYAEYLDSGMARYLKKAFPTINHNISGIHI